MKKPAASAKLVTNLCGRFGRKRCSARSVSPVNPHTPITIWCGENVPGATG